MLLCSVVFFIGKNNQHGGPVMTKSTGTFKAPKEHSAYPIPNMSQWCFQIYLPCSSLWHVIFQVQMVICKLPGGVSWRCVEFFCQRSIMIQRIKSEDSSCHLPLFMYLVLPCGSLFSLVSNKWYPDFNPPRKELWNTKGSRLFWSTSLSPMKDEL